MKGGMTNDTIAALATPVGGGVAVVRISGPHAVELAEQVWRCRNRRPLAQLPARTLHLGEAGEADGMAIDRCLAVRFQAPASYTGEDMVEIHGHGGGLVARQILLALLNQGARHAEPGEFTRRAFLNGKMDLTQAEAVADIVQAHSLMALRLGKRQLDGRLGQQVAGIYDRLSLLLAEVESQLDFPDEEIERVPGQKLASELAALQQETQMLLESRLEGEVLRQGVSLVLAGPPNVGKSSLMNAILGRDRAIVNHLPGTTRDTLEEFAHVRGIPVRLIDTAGIREARNAVESAGIARALASMREAQVVIWVSDVRKPMQTQAMPPDFARLPVLGVLNKCDRLPVGSTPPARTGEVCVSALTGDGLEELFDAVERMVWHNPHEHEPEVAVGARHAALLEQAMPSLREAEQNLLDDQPEMAAVALRDALEPIGMIHGKTVLPDVLDTIFSRFCIGK